MKTKRERPIPEIKLKTVKELTDLIKKKSTILVASIKNLPSEQFQLIGKKFRGKAIIKVPKKNLFFMALDKSGIEQADKIKENYIDSIALLFSDLDSYDLSADLLKNKVSAKAKPGQEAPADIQVNEGPTDLPPGPAISELGAVGLKVGIEKGKIHIKESKVIVKAGQKISQAAADVMSKLDIKPFSIGFNPLFALDNKNHKLYLNIKIDKDETVAELKNSFGKSLAFAVEIGYASENTITFLLGKAVRYEKALSALMKTDAQTPENKPEEAKVEEKPAEASAEKSGEEK
jgi:large subunit ribosomal protein L10